MVRFVRRAGATVVTVLLVTALAGLACLFWLGAARRVARPDGRHRSMEPTVPTGA